jgi:hypothetical protein
VGGWVGGWSSQFLIPHLRPSYRMGLSSGPSVAIIYLFVPLAPPMLLGQANNNLKHKNPFKVMKHKSDNKSMEFQNSCQLTFNTFADIQNMKKVTYEKKIIVYKYGGGREKNYNKIYLQGFQSK